MSGCAASGSAPLGRALPPAPSYLAPVAVPQIAKGDDARVSLAKHRASLLGANRRLVDSRDWYENKVRKPFAAGR